MMLKAGLGPTAKEASAVAIKIPYQVLEQAAKEFSNNVVLDPTVG
jgi:hypothetical protein